MRPSRRLQFWMRWLEVCAALFAIQSALWSVLGTFDPWGFYDGFLAKALMASHALTPQAAKVWAFANVLLGATSAAYFVLFFAVTRAALARGERWAWWSLTVSSLTWFTIDSAFSLAHGAAFNVVLVNVPCLVALGLPLAAIARPILVGGKPTS